MSDHDYVQLGLPFVGERGMLSVILLLKLIGRFIVEEKVES